MGYETILSAILAGGCAAAIIKLVDNFLIARVHINARNHEARMTASEGQIKEIYKSQSNLELGMQAILHDRLKYLCRAYIADGAVKSDDLDDLLKMHESYQTLGGNGHLTLLMDKVTRLKIT